MDSSGLYFQVRDAKESTDACYLVIHRFEPLIGRLVKSLKFDFQDWEDAKQDFRIKLMQVIRVCPLQNFPVGSDVEVLSYIMKAMTRYVKQYLKTRERNWNVSEFDQDDQMFIEPDPVQHENNIEMKDLISRLKNRDQQVIVGYYFTGYSDNELAEKLHISRQAVYKCRMHALEILKKNIKGE